MLLFFSDNDVENDEDVPGKKLIQIIQNMPERVK